MELNNKDIQEHFTLSNYFTNSRYSLSTKSRDLASRFAGNDMMLQDIFALSQLKNPTASHQQLDVATLQQQTTNTTTNGNAKIRMKRSKLKLTTMKTDRKKEVMDQIKKKACEQMSQRLQELDKLNPKRFARRPSQEHQGSDSNYLSVQRFHSNASASNANSRPSSQLTYCQSNQNLKQTSQMLQQSERPDIKRAVATALTSKPPIQRKKRMNLVLTDLAYKSFQDAYSSQSRVQTPQILTAFNQENYQSNQQQQVQSFPILLPISRSNSSCGGRSDKQLQRGLSMSSLNTQLKQVNKLRKSQIQNLVFKIDDYIQAEKENNNKFVKNKQETISKVTTKLKEMKNIIEADIDYDTYKMFTEEEKLKAIGQMNKEIENTGYAFKTNKRKYSMERKPIKINQLIRS